MNILPDELSTYLTSDQDTYHYNPFSENQTYLFQYAQFCHIDPKQTPFRLSDIENFMEMARQTNRNFLRHDDEKRDPRHPLQIRAFDSSLFSTNPPLCPRTPWDHTDSILFNTIFQGKYRDTDYHEAAKEFTCCHQHKGISGKCSACIEREL